MLNSVETLYITLLRASNPSIELQERAFEYAKNSKNSKILLTLIQLENLTDELDEKLGINPSAHVLAEWIDRKPRSTETLTDIALKAKSQKVFKILAQQPNLTLEAYLKIAEQEDPESSIALCQNPNVPSHVKVKLGPGLAKVRILKNAESLTQILQDSPELLEGILGSPTITKEVWRAMLGVNHLPEEHHSALIKGIRAGVEEGFLFRDSILSNVLDRNSFTAELLIEFHAVLHIKDAKGSTAGHDFTLAKVEKLIKAAAGKDELILKIQNAASQEEFDALVPAASRSDRSVAMSVIMSPFFSIENAEELTKGLTWGVSLSLFELVRHDLDKLFLLLAASPYHPGSTILGKIENPEAMVTRLVDHFKGNPGGWLYWFIESEYFNPELVAVLSPSFLQLHSPMPDAAIKELDRLLFTAFKDDASAWDTFESLLGSHEGSIEDLIAVVVALCDLPEEE